MKGSLVIFLLLLISFTTYRQIVGGVLIGLTNATNAEMNAVTNPIQRSLLYNTDEKRVYQFDGTNWDELIIKAKPTVESKTGSYTLTATDNRSVFTFNSNTDITLTASAGLPIGFNVSVYQIGDGHVTISGNPGVAIKNRLSRFKTAGESSIMINKLK